ncbi:MAG: hypothetical protein KDA22_16970 [Phycisphaerales bacterium]|nr:hypothetical protein [Phycisphaerales bacterium]
MKRETTVWLVVMLVGLAMLVAKGVVSGVGREYVQTEQKRFVQVEVPPPIGADADEKPTTQWLPAADAAARSLTPVPGSTELGWTAESPVTPRAYWEGMKADPSRTDLRLSVPRTIGLWVAAFFTLAIFSFLYRDNPFYKIAEACVVGVSAAYWMVVGFWDVIMPNMMAKLSPDSVRWAIPDVTGEPEWAYTVPLVLSIMLLWRLSPKGAWIARWPLAFIIGTTAGLRLVAFLHTDFLAQIRNSILPLAVVDQTAGFQFWPSFNNIVLVGAVLACLVYFFFSFEHKGFVGGVARGGIWVLMITFGAGFGYTVMGRIALLAIRLEFLMDNWLWLIDPTNIHTKIT